MSEVEKEVAEQNKEASESQPSQELAKEAKKLSKEDKEAKKANDERLKEQAREDALVNRFKALKNAVLASRELNLGNPELYFNQHILFAKDQKKALELMATLEAKDAEIHKNACNDKNRAERKAELTKIDQQLLEALAEQAEGNDAKLKEYLKKRKAIKDSLPLLK